MTAAIEVTGLSVTHGSRAVLNNLQLTISAGSRVVLTGNNGAGKSTLLCAIAGVLPTPTVRIQGLPHSDRRSRSQLSWCPGGARLPDAWTPRELFDLRRAQLRAPSSPSSPQLSQLLNQPIRTLSAGERQRVALHLALTGPPEVVLLDEPLEHLDADARAEVLALVDAHPTITFVIATHRPDDWKSRATRILRLHNAALEEL